MPDDMSPLGRELFAFAGSLQQMHTGAFQNGDRHGENARKLLRAVRAMCRAQADLHAIQVLTQGRFTLPEEEYQKLLDSARTTLCDAIAEAGL